MSPSDITAADKALRERIDADAQDSLDEELEMELDETRLDGIASIESSFALSQVKYSIALPV